MIHGKNHVFILELCVTDCKMSRKVSLNKKHGFLVGIQRQLHQQAQELGFPPVDIASPVDQTNSLEPTSPMNHTSTATGATDKTSLHVAADCLCVNVSDNKVSRKVSLNKNHRFLFNIQHQLQQHAQEFHHPPVDLASPVHQTNPVEPTSPMNHTSTDETSLHVATEYLQPGTVVSSSSCSSWLAGLASLIT